MSDLGDDLNEVHGEIGNSFGIIRAGEVTSSGEYCILKMNRQVTKPFIQEFFLEGRFDWDTEAGAGDVIQFNDNRRFMIMNLVPIVFQDEAIEQGGVLYKCNVSGELLRPAEVEGWDADYREKAGFALVAQDVFALQTESLYGNELDTDEELGNLGLRSDELYVPASSGVQVLDRYQPVSGEYYKIETIQKRRFDNIWVCNIKEDTR